MVLGLYDVLLTDDGLCDFIAKLSQFYKLFAGGIGFIQGCLLRGDMDVSKFKALVVQFNADLQRRQLSVDDLIYGRLFDSLLDEAEVLVNNQVGSNPLISFIEHEANQPDEDEE